MPALIAAAILSGAEMEGPIVATIFARLMYLTFVSCGAGLRVKTHCLCGSTRGNSHIYPQKTARSQRAVL